MPGLEDLKFPRGYQMGTHNYFLIQLNNLHFYILKNLFIPDIVQVLFKLN